MNNEIVRLLHEAKTHLEQIIPQLDRTESHCGHCKRRSFANWDEAQMAKELEAMARKLGGFLGKTQLPPRPGPEIRTEKTWHKWEGADQPTPKRVEVVLGANMVDAPKGYFFGRVISRDLVHLVHSGDWAENTAVCGVSIHGEGKIDAVHKDSKFCDKCRKKAEFGLSRGDMKSMRGD